MRYSVILTESQKHVRAMVPSLPECWVEANSRQAAIEKIQETVFNFLKQREVVFIDVPFTPKDSNEKLDTPWDIFGAFINDPTWPTLFEDIETKRSSELA